LILARAGTRSASPLGLCNASRVRAATAAALRIYSGAPAALDLPFSCLQGISATISATYSSRRLARSCQMQVLKEAASPLLAVFITFLATVAVKKS